MGQVVTGLFAEEANGLRQAILSRLAGYMNTDPKYPRRRENVISIIENYRRDFIAHFGVHDFTRKHGVDSDNHILVLSASPSRQSSGRTAIVLNYSPDYYKVEGYLFDHLPDLNEVVRNPQRLKSMSEEQRAEAMSLDNRLSLAMYYTQRKKSPLGNTELQNIEPLLNPRALRDIGRKARRDTAHLIARLFEDEDGQTELSRDLEHILEDFEMPKLNSVIDQWCEHLDPAALELMRTRDVPRSIDFLKFLTPHAFVRREEPHPRHAHKTISRGEYVYQEEAAIRRQNLICKYPLLAWERKTIKDRRFFEDFDEGKAPLDETAARFFGADPARIEYLAGLQRDDIGFQMHALPAISEHLDLFDETPMPHTPQEWKSYVCLLNTDGYLADHKLREAGSTIQACANEFDRFGSWRAAEQFLNPQGDRSICSVVGPIERGMKRIGYSILGSFAYQTVTQRPDISKYTSSTSTSWFVESMILPLCVPEESHDSYAETRLYKAFGKDRPNLLRMLFDDTPFFELVDKTSDFFRSEANIRYLEMRETWAIKKAMREQPLKYGWVDLPEPQGEERLHLEVISTASDLLQAGEEMESRVGFQGYKAVTARTHFVRAVDPRTSLTRAVACLTECQNEDGPMRLAFNANFDIYGPEDNGMVPTIAAEQVEAYVARINQMDLPAFEFENRRDSMRKNALSYGALRGIIGHDPSQPFENQQAVEVLGGLIPDQYTGIGPGGVIEAPKLAAYLIDQVHRIKGRPAATAPGGQLRAIA